MYEELRMDERKTGVSMTGDSMACGVNRRCLAECLSNEYTCEQMPSLTDGKRGNRRNPLTPFNLADTTCAVALARTLTSHTQAHVGSECGRFCGI